MSRLILFDIDNTLLYTGGAGSFAMNNAFNQLFGIADGFARVEFSGRTDLFILQEGLSGHGIEGGPEKHLDAFTRTYYGLLPDALTQREGHLMPGFPELLTSLKDADARLGLATGNFSVAARIKLEFYDISQFFTGGGFGEVSIHRRDLVTEAIRTLANGTSPSDIVVIGDTPHDVTSALDNGAIGVGVATGKYTLEELRDSGAHAVFTDFSDWEAAAAQLLTVS